WLEQNVQTSGCSTIELPVFYLFILKHQKELLDCQPVNIARCNISINCLVLLNWSYYL
ncbi:unnamed protein product, partial [Bubo scandiacus]